MVKNQTADETNDEAIEAFIQGIKDGVDDTALASLWRVLKGPDRAACANAIALGHMIIEEIPYSPELGTVLYSESQLNAAQLQAIQRDKISLVRKGGTYAEFDYEDSIAGEPDEHRMKLQIPQAKTKEEVNSGKVSDDTVDLKKHAPSDPPSDAMLTKPYNVLKTLEFGYLDHQKDKTPTLCIFYCGHDS
ncbi:MAG: hypothetical protein ACKVVP_16985 [Chloroflexota bacterium]